MRSSVSRREFLERASYAATLAMLARRGVSAASGMWVSLNFATTRGVGWPDMADLAAKLGFAGVDWSLGAPATETRPASGARKEGLDATKALFADLKLHPTIVGLPINAFNATDDSFKSSLALLDDQAAFVAAVGCGKMMTTLSPTSPRPKDDQRKFVQDRMGPVSEILGKYNIRLGLEFLGPLYMRSGGPSPCPARAGGPRGGRRAGGGPRIPFMWTLPETVALANDCGPNIGVVLDAWHWHHSGGTVADILAVDKSRIVQIHVSDAKAIPPEEVCDSERLMPGEGVINLVGFFQALQKIGYDSSVSPEPLGRVPPEMSAEDGSKLALETTLAVMKKAGAI